MLYFVAPRVLNHADMPLSKRNVIEVGAPIVASMTQAGNAEKVRIRVGHRADVAAFYAAFYFQDLWQKPTVMAQR
jgi:hypothetical protein